MEKIQGIEVVEVADLGPVIARADHQENVIEVNRRIFYGLPPMAQEFVLCHEVCHLTHNEWDEGRTNQLAAQLFLSRAKGDTDLKARKHFLSYLDGNGGYSNEAIAAIVIAAVSAAVAIGSTIYSIVASRNAGWYSWNQATKKTWLESALRTSFEQARRSGSHSAAEFFWAQLSACTNKDESLEEWQGRSVNDWTKNIIAKYEKTYGFGFKEVTPIDLTVYPLVIVAIGALIGFIVYRIIKKRKK